MSSNTPTPYPISTAAWADDELRAKNPAAAASHPTHPPHKPAAMLPGAERRDARDDFDDGRTPQPSESSESYEKTGTSLAAPGPLAMESERLDPEGRNAWTEWQPSGVRPGESGDSARAEVPETHASVTDKLIGKTQKVIGKVTGNPGMHDRGELREAGDKPAARGKGRGPHD
ncbi:hypothetical protein V8D89_003069 [Ganoderma adspersum]